MRPQAIENASVEDSAWLLYWISNKNNYLPLL